MKLSPAYRLWLVVLFSMVALGATAVTQPVMRVIVHFTPDSTITERIEWLTTHEVVVRLDALDAVVIHTQQKLDVLQQSSVVSQVEIDAPIILLQDEYLSGVISHSMQPAPPPDPQYGMQWNLQAIAAPDAWMRLPKMHDVTIAMIDSGICIGHSEFDGVPLLGYDFVDDDRIPQDEYGHGCGVAGIIGATRQNNLGMAGVLNGAELMALRVADKEGQGYSSMVAQALIYAVDHNVDVINLSLGIKEDMHLLRRAIQYAGHIPTVAATGDSTKAYYPAAYEGVIAVGGHDVNRQIVSDTPADYYAPAIDILTTDLNGGFTQMSGTSAASTQVAGMIALQALTDGEMMLDTTTPLARLVPSPAAPQPAGAQQIKVFVIVYQSSTPLYDPLKLNALTLADMTRSTVAHGYERPQGQPAIEFVLAADPVVVDGAPPPPDPSYDADYNYAAIYDDFDLCQQIQRHDVDEVWLWGEANPAHGNGLEWVTNGPQIQWTWGSNVPDCGRTITTMWFEYNREVALALHSYGHRMEGAFMLRMPCQFMTASTPWAGKQWLAEQGLNDCGDQLSDTTGFVARAHHNNGHLSGCGDVHAPPNVPVGDAPYQYDVPDVVRSVCEDWQRDGSATVAEFGCERWQCNERDYHIWWKQNIPGIGYEHRDSDGSIMPNWYDYLYDIEPN